MRDDLWHALEPHLDRALDLSDFERRAWLEGLRAQDPKLAADLERLLAFHEAISQEDFLEDAFSARPSVASLAGQAVGAYTLIESIGQGGMGSVWLARRSDGRFEGRVAVKLLNASLVGRTGEERFRREGNILARLADPHIARLFDAGVSPMGQPFLVLEYVEGDPIDRYCDGKGLGVEERLRLFLDVLAAVAQAHSNLIVHRDIKPSNVLVGLAGQVKLLDFGIAKLLEGEAGSGEATALTQEGGRALTPEYAAPEQVTGGAITTATDVFSLGTLLYVLLAGRHPAEVALRSPAGLLKAIIETDPRRPSDSSDLRDSATLRSTSPDALRRLLRGDLDTIVAKALKKKPEERYSSVAAFADDIRRYLGHQPISARPDTLGYRARKFVRRNRTPVVLSALAVLALISGLVGTFTQARRAQRHAALAGEQRDFAVSQLLRAEAINDLNAFLLSDAAPSGKPFTVGDLLARAERVVAAERGALDENRVEILMAIGSQYWNQDEDENARRVLGRAYELSRGLPNRPLQAKAACTLAMAVVRAGEADRAEALIQEGLAGLPTQPQFTLDRVRCLWRGSYVAREAGDDKAGVERVQAARRVLRDSGLAYPLLDLRVAMEEAEAYRMASRHLEANAAFQRAALGLAALGRDDTQTAGTLFNNWGLTLDLLGQSLKAESIFRRAIRISADGTERTVSPMLLNNLARTLGELHRLAEAQGYADRAYARARQAGDEVVVNQSLLVRASLYRQLGDLERAAKMLAEVEPRLTRMLPRGHWAFGSLASQKALLAQARGDFAVAKAAADRAVAIAETAQREDFLQLVLLRRAELELQMLLWEQARADAARALGTWPAVLQPGIFSSRVGRCNMALGRALQPQGKTSEARVAFASAVEHLEPSLGSDHPDTREARKLAAAEVATR